MKLLKITAKMVIVFLPFVIFSLYAKFFMLRFCDGEIPFYIWNKNLKNQSFDVCIIGDSTCNSAYIPNILGTNTINISLGGTSTVENYYTFSNYLKKNMKPKICYISFADEHLQEVGCLYSRTLYSHILNFTQQNEIFRNAIKYNEKSILIKDWLKEWLSFYFYTPEKYTVSLLASDDSRVSYNKKRLYLDDIHFGSYISWTSREDYDTQPYTKDDFYVGELFDFYYRKIIDLCIENDIQVRIVKLPINSPANHTDKYINEFWDYYNSLKLDYPSITVDWIMNGFDQKDFCDYHHMNINGAIRFSNLIKEIYPEDFAFNKPDLNEKVKMGIQDYLQITNDPEHQKDLQSILLKL